MSNFTSIDEYIAASAIEVREILSKIREDAKQAVPVAEECISYNIPALKQKRVFFILLLLKNTLAFTRR